MVRYWCYLARRLAELEPEFPDAEYKRHCAEAYNRRAREMDCSLGRLALFLDVRYKAAASAPSTMLTLVETAVELWKQRGHGEAECRQLIQQLQLYAMGADPYDAPACSPRQWWTAVLDPNTNRALVGLALLLLDIVPHAADPERVFSAMGWFSNGRRNRMGQQLMTVLTAIKMDQDQRLHLKHTKTPEGARAVQGNGLCVTNEEALATAASTSAAAAVMPAEEVEVDDDVDLINATPEQLDNVVRSMYEAEAAAQLDSGTLTYTDLLMQPWPGIDITAAQLDPTYTGVPPPAGPPLGALGGGESTAFDVSQLVQQTMAGWQPVA